jgi:hypothetical protein
MEVPGRFVLLLASFGVVRLVSADAALAQACGRDASTRPPAGCVSANEGWHFTDVTLEAGFDYSHGYAGFRRKNGQQVPRTRVSDRERIAGGVASGDVDGDGLVDLYAIRGTIGPNLLFRNRGDGTFEEVRSAGVAIRNTPGAGPAFADIDGDGDLDLLVNGTQDTTSRVFRNRGDGTFEEITAESGLASVKRNTYSAAFGDVDGDGDLDLSMAHWNSLPDTGDSPQQLFENDGTGHFRDVSVSSGVSSAIPRPSSIDEDNIAEYTFAPNLTDIDADGWVDLVVAADFQTSMVLHNRGDGTFEDWTTPVISDENGMGASMGDVDNDGDLDWFVTSIYDEDGVAEGNWGVTGNRLYINDGAGNFSDGTDAAGVRHGFWGWASCLQDFDNDGDLDIFHVNGWAPRAGNSFAIDPSRLFLNRGDGTFVEGAERHGIDDQGNGRGIVCFDADRDGDIDIFIANSLQPPRFYRNDGGNRLNHLSVRLRGPAGNSEGIGAWVFVETFRRRQLREIRAGSNFSSQDPAEAHFGLGSAQFALRVEVHWPDGEVSVRPWVPANSWLVIEHPFLDENHPGRYHRRGHRPRPRDGR